MKTRSFMSNKGKYCCFNCPKDDFREKDFNEKCPTCNLPYGFPLFNNPKIIRDFKIIRPLGRGFYGATFIAENSGIVPKKQVLKVVPRSLYDYFKKSFEEECKIHSEAANGADFLVDLQDAFNHEVNFGDIKINCHIFVLEYIDGSLLQEYLSGRISISAASIAQIAADLFRIRDELINRKLNHNDFHAGNIMVESLSKERQRRDAIDPSIRAVAIDLGSLSPDRRSGGKYKGDLHWIAHHIEELTTNHIRAKNEVSDLENRLELALRNIARSVTPSVEKQRTPSSEEIIRSIEEEYYRSSEPWRPWRTALELRKFDDYYNARNLQAWYVPQLLVDPGNKWKTKISSPGPLVVTGMRGCGKTMLLRSLQFHARAVQNSKDTNQDVIKRLKQDGYVGFFASGAKLLTLSEEELLNRNNMLGRLVLAYALEVSRSLAHLNDISSKLVNKRAAYLVQDALTSILESFIRNENVLSIQELERHLIGQLNSACRVNSKIKISSHPNNAFPLFARSIKECSEIWRDSQVLFLLDEVSTRTLTTEQIDEILSSLLFQSTDCAFKLTSETQTIFLNLKSPGGLEPAAHWRDFSTFDLGAEVHKKLKRKGGKKFIEKILSQRAQFFSAHPAIPTSKILGDISLANISRNITSSNPNSPDRKKAYHGLSVLKAVCVGDIGSTITIYEKILNHLNGTYPIKPQLQNDEFQEFCSIQLYLLDRREGYLKSIAKSFAEASYELLMQSAKKKEDRGLRQYLSIYIRVTAGDKEEQGKRLRELVDAGVFVFQGGAPRTKTKDSDPILQFKLTYRKIYGLADFIGLAERDRFELSGPELEEWLRQPENGKEILIRNLSTEVTTEDEFDEEYEDEIVNHFPEEKEELSQTNQQLGLFRRDKIFDNLYDQNDPVKQLISLPKIQRISSSNLQNVDLLFVALGFEDRALTSISKCLEKFRPKKIVAIKYNEKGYSEEILEIINTKNILLDIKDYETIVSNKENLISGETKIAIDITGLTKAAIFQIVKSSFSKQQNEVFIIYTGAADYYPLEESLNKVLKAQNNKNYHLLLEELKDVLSGENGPYNLKSLQSVESDVSRMRALFAFASPKHERLIKLVEERTYDQIEVLIDSSNSPRTTVSRLAAEVAVRETATGSIHEGNSRNPNEVLKRLEQSYQKLYFYGGMNFEIGLTGDKIDALAAAIFCSVVNVNNVWYVKPESFDPKRFSTGSGETLFYKIKMPNNER